MVIDGFPGTIASFRQQAGRAGRSGDASAAVLVAGSDQLDQWLAANPDGAAHPGARAGGGEPGQPLRARPAPAVRGPRAPAQPRRRALVAGPARRRRAPARAGRRAGGAAPRSPPRADRGVDRHRLAEPRRRAPQRGRRAGAHRHARGRAAHRRRRPRSRARAGARRRVVPPPGSALAGGLARSRGGRRPRRARRRHHLHGPAPRHRGAPARRRSGSSGRARRGCSSAPSRCTPRSSATSARTRVTGAVVDTAPLDLPRSTLRHPGGVVRGRRRASWRAPGIDRAALPGALHAIEHAAIGMLPAVRHLRSLGRRRRVHRVPRRHRAAHDRDLRRHARRRRGGRARLRGRRSPPAGHPAEHRGLPVRRRLPVVHPEPEVRQRQRPPRQARRPRPPRRDPRILVARLRRAPRAERTAFGRLVAGRVRRSRPLPVGGSGGASAPHTPRRRHLSSVHYGSWRRCGRGLLLR